MKCPSKGGFHGTLGTPPGSATGRGFLWLVVVHVVYTFGVGYQGRGSSLHGRAVPSLIGLGSIGLLQIVVGARLVVDRKFHSCLGVFHVGL